jgi:hypothetical protein
MLRINFDEIDRYMLTCKKKYITPDRKYLINTIRELNYAKDYIQDKKIVEKILLYISRLTEYLILVDARNTDELQSAWKQI